MKPALKLQFKQTFVKTKKAFILKKECTKVGWWLCSNRLKQTQHCFISFSNRWSLTRSWNDSESDDHLAFAVRANTLLQINLQWICMHVKDLWTPHSLVNKAKFVCGNRGRQRVHLTADQPCSAELSTSQRHICLQTSTEWLRKHGPSVLL